MSTPRAIHHFINGQIVPGTSGRTGNVFDPNTGEVQAHVDLATTRELNDAVEIAKAAQPAWAATNPQRRARVLFKFKQLLEENMDELAVPWSSSSSGNGGNATITSPHPASSGAVAPSDDAETVLSGDQAFDLMLLLAI